MTMCKSGMTALLVILLSLTFTACKSVRPVFAPLQSTSTASADNISSSQEVMELEDAGISVIQLGDNVDIIIPTDVFFKYGTIELDPYYRWVIDDVVAIIEDYDLIPINITGYTDNVGDETINRRFSLHRAERVESYLWEHGIDFHRIKSHGAGSKPIIATNRTVEGSGINRRLVIHMRLQPGDDLV